MLTPSITLFVFGVLCMITPVLSVALGAKDEADIYTWLARQPLHYIMFYRAMFMSGNLFMAGAMLLP